MQFFVGSLNVVTLIKFTMCWIALGRCGEHVLLLKDVAKDHKWQGKK